MMSYVAAHAGRMCVKSSSNHGCHHYWLTPTSTHTHTHKCTLQAVFLCIKHRNLALETWNFLSATSCTFMVFGTCSKLSKRKLWFCCWSLISPQNRQNLYNYTHMVLEADLRLFPPPKTLGTGSVPVLKRSWSPLEPGGARYLVAMTTNHSKSHEGK